MIFRSKTFVDQKKSKIFSTQKMFQPNCFIRKRFSTKKFDKKNLWTNFFSPNCFQGKNYATKRNFNQKNYRPNNFFIQISEKNNLAKKTIRQKMLSIKTFRGIEVTTTKIRPHTHTCTNEHTYTD